MNYKQKTAKGAAIALLMAWSVHAVAQAPKNLMDQAEALMRSGKPQEAYAQLAPHEFDDAGDVEFDYLLGIAALDSGRPDRATIAFERVLAVNPGFAGARLDMARAYFALGDYARAKLELETVAGQNPPPQGKAVIEKYLAAIAERQKIKLTTWTGYAEASAGYDDNVTSVTKDFTGGVLASYGFPGVQPTGNSIKRSDGFAGLAAGVDVSHLLNEQLAVYFGVDARQRLYQTHTAFDSTSLDARAGIALSRGANLYRFGIQAQQYRQEGETPGTPKPHMDRDTRGVNLEWRRVVDERTQVSAFAQYNVQRYADLPTSDVDQVLAGVSYLRALPGAGSPVVFASVFGSDDDARNPLANGSDVGKRTVGARVYGQYSLNDDLSAFVSLGYQHRKDKSAFARSTVVADGRDRQTDVSLGANWRPAPLWTVRPQITTTDNESNIALYDYRRTEASVNVRRDFK